MCRSFTIRSFFAKCRVPDRPDPTPMAFCRWAFQPFVRSNPATHEQAPLTFQKFLVLSFPRQPFVLPRHGTKEPHDKPPGETSFLQPYLFLKRVERQKSSPF